MVKRLLCMLALLVPIQVAVTPAHSYALEQSDLQQRIDAWIANKDLPALHENKRLEALKIQIAADIFAHPAIAQSLALKGGAPALWLHNLDRYTLDLDFDLIDDAHEETAFRTLAKVLSAYGTVRARNKKSDFKFELSYKNKRLISYILKLEVSKRKYGSCYEQHQFLGIPLQVIVQRDMAAHKLVFMYERRGKPNKSVYDVWFFLRNGWPINKQIVEYRTGMPYKQFLVACKEYIATVDSARVVDGLVDMLDEYRIAWAKEHLKDELLQLLEAAVAKEDEKMCS